MVSKRKPGEQGSSRTKKTARHLITAAGPAYGSSTPSLQPIHDSDIPEGLPATNRIKTWKLHVSSTNLQVVSRLEYTPRRIVNADTTLDREVKHFRDADKFDGRDFVLHGVAEFTAMRRGGPRICRVIRVINKADPTAQPLQLYRYFDDNEQNVSARDLAGALDDSICPSDADARTLAEICCTLLNKFPASLQEHKWNDVSVVDGQKCWPRQFVEWIALQNFDPDSWSDQETTPGLYQSFTAHGSGIWFFNRPLHVFRKRAAGDVTVLSIPTLYRNQTKPDIVYLWINHRRLKLDAIEHDIPNNYDFPTPDLDDESWNKMDAAVLRCLHKLTNYITELTIGYVAASKYRFEMYAKGLMEPYTGQRKVADKGGSVVTGPFGGKPFLTVDLSIPEDGIHRSFISLKASAELDASLSGTLPMIYSTIGKRLAVWYAVACAMRGLAMNVDQLNIWQDMIIKLTQAEHGMLTQQQMLEDIFQYTTDADPEKCCLPCALCLRIYRLEDLEALEDGRFICERHDSDAYYTGLDSRNPQLDRLVWPESIEFDPQDSKLFNSKSSPLALAVMRAGKRELKSGGHKIDLQVMLDRLREFQIPGQPTQWLDVYDGPRRLEDAVYTNQPEGSRPRRHALSPSLEAIFPFYRSVDGRVFYHAPSNVGITPWELNSLKGNSPPAILPILREGARQTWREQAQMRDRDVPLKDVRNESFWQDFHHRLDHICRININIPYRLDSRLAINVTQEQYDRYTEAWRSGQWSNELSSFVGKRRPVPLTMTDTISDDMACGNSAVPRSNKAKWISQARTEALDKNKIYHKIWPPWTHEQIGGCKNFMEALRNYPGTNPHNAAMRFSSNGAPWPFLDSTFPEDEADLWKWWQRFSTRALWMLDDECDLENETIESNMTVMLVYVICFYDDGGGIDSFMHCSRVPFMRHGAKASLARAEGILPGAHLRTGLTTPYPSSLAHYIAANRTIGVQPWFTNLLWHDAPPTEHPLQLQRLANLPPSTEYYDALKPCIPMKDFIPRESTMSRVSKKMIGSEENPVDIDDDDRPFGPDYIDLDATDHGAGSQGDGELGPGESLCAVCEHRANTAAMASCDQHQDRGLSPVRFHSGCALTSDYLPNKRLCSGCKIEADALLARSVRSNAPVQLLWHDNSCFVNSTLQVMDHVDLIRRIVLDLKSATGKQVSGRKPSLWLRRSDGIPKTEAEEAEKFKSCLKNAEGLTHAMWKLIKKMDEGKHIQYSREMKNHLEPILDVDRFTIRPGGINDASEMFFIILESMILVTDKSPAGQFGMRKLELKVRREVVSQEVAAHDSGLLPLTEEVNMQYEITLLEGRDSELYKAFALQIVSEFCCADKDCKRIRRDIRDFYRLNLIGADQDTDLKTAIQNSIATKTDHLIADRRSITASCISKKHTGAMRSWDRFTSLPHILWIGFPHGEIGERIVLGNKIELPELLDMHSLADGVILPSQSRSSPESLTSHCIYRLQAICIFKSTHYTAHAVRNGRWMLFDDMQSRKDPEVVHPQRSINDGWVPYYAIYEKQSGRTTLPRTENGKNWTNGHVIKLGATPPAAEVVDYTDSWRDASRHQCDFAREGCAETFPTLELAREHTLSGCFHQQGRIEFFCPDCSETFLMEEDLENHLRMKKFKCGRKLSSGKTCLMVATADADSGKVALHEHCRKCDVVSRNSETRKKHEDGHCPHCERYIDNEVLRTRHIQQEHDFKCELCDRSFDSRLQLVNHFNTARDHIWCEACGEFLNDLAARLDHYWKEHQQCPVCLERYFPSDDTKLIQHAIEDHERCHDCDKLFKDKQAMNEHSLSHEEGHCPHCGQEIIGRAALDAHKVHCNKKICRKCDTVCNNDESLAMHIRQFHEEHTCQHCGARIVGRAELAAHKDGCGKKKCPHCDAACDDEESLAEHIRQSHEEYICPECGMVFATGGTLAEHELTHETAEQQRGTAILTHVVTAAVRAALEEVTQAVKQLATTVNVAEAAKKPTTAEEQYWAERKEADEKDRAERKEAEKQYWAERKEADEKDRAERKIAESESRTFKLASLRNKRAKYEKRLDSAEVQHQEKLEKTTKLPAGAWQSRVEADSKLNAQKDHMELLRRTITDIGKEIKYLEALEPGTMRE